MPAFDDLKFNYPINGHSFKNVYFQTKSLNPSDSHINLYVIEEDGILYQMFDQGLFPIIPPESIEMCTAGIEDEHGKTDMNKGRFRQFIVYFYKGKVSNIREFIDEIDIKSQGAE